MIIYKATNIFDGKCYIGQTVKSLKKRRANHLYNTKNNKDNYYFHNAIRKYGPDNFTWEVLCECDSREELDEMEYHYIKSFHSHVNEDGYNLTCGGSMGYTLTEEARQRIRQRMSGRMVSEETKQKMSARMMGNTNAPKGKDNYNYGKCGSKHATSKVYKVIHPNGVEEIVHGLSEWCKSRGLDQSHLCKVANGKCKHCKGYKCEYVDSQQMDISDAEIDVLLAYTPPAPEPSKWQKYAFLRSRPDFSKIVRC